MTKEDREKAIQVFEDMKRGINPWYPEEYCDMAIEALSTEPCEDTISRADTIEWLKRVTVTDGITFETGFKQILTDIQNMPLVIPKQKIGRWIKVSPMTKPYCSECGKSCIGIHGFNYVVTDFCPHCGAKMESEV